MVKVQVPQKRDARPVDGLTEIALNCDALIPKAKATAEELIRIPVILGGGSQN
jgi:hypothetical protein